MREGLFRSILSGTSNHARAGPERSRYRRHCKSTKKKNRDLPDILSFVSRYEKSVVNQYNRKNKTDMGICTHSRFDRPESNALPHSQKEIYFFCRYLKLV